MDHSNELLIEHQLTARTTRTTGPIPEFLAKKEAERAPRTYAWHRETLTALWDFLAARDLTTIGDFDEGAVNLFRLELRSRGLRANTISSRLRSIKAFARWMYQRGWTPTNVLEFMHVPQTTKPHFDLIDDGVRARLFALYSPNTYLGSRNQAMLAVLSDTGLRREELVNLQLKNLDLDAQVMKVFADKTEEWRYLPLTDEVVKILRNYLTWRERYFARPSRPRIKGSEQRRKEARRVDCGNLFLGWDGRRLTPPALAEILRRASQKLGVRLHAHLFRHDWITRKALDGESPSLVKRWAGHRTFMMTDYYFSLADDMLGAIQPKRSVLAAIPIPGAPKRGRPPKVSRR
jgi:site-specific recombinase XerD